MSYNKPYLPVADQITLIKRRGIVISDDALAQSYLEKIGYYRLSGYWYPYRRSATGDQFREGSKFPEVLELYVFDKKLRLLFLDVIERIEIALRVRITLQLGQAGPLAHRTAAALHGNFSLKKDPQTNLTRHNIWLDRHDKSFANSKEEFAKHFKAKYPNEYPPLWIAAEVWDFGTMSILFSGLKKNDQTAIAATFGVRSFSVMASWLHAINVARNICAHHSRFWNKANVAQPKWPSEADCPSLAHVNGNNHAQTRLYGTAAICAYLLLSINPNSTWRARFKELIAQFPQSNIVSLNSAGFPAGWDTEQIWN